MSLGCDDLGDSFAVCIDDAGEIHHFRKTQNPSVFKETVDVPVIQICTGFIQRRGGNAGGNHEHGIHGKTFCGTEHIVNAVGAHDIGDLMRIGNDGGGAVGDNCPDEFAGRDQTGFQMDVGIDEAGADHFAGHISFHMALVIAKTHDQTLRNSNVTGFQFAGENIYIGCVFQDKICFFAACGNINDMQFFQQLAVDFSGPAFCIAHKYTPFSEFYPSYHSFPQK